MIALPIVSPRPLPSQLYLEVTNRCNLKCKTCPQYFGMPEPFSDMSVAMVEAILGQLPAVERVVLHGIGESALNRELPTIVSRVKARGAYALMNSNGTALKASKLESLVAAGLDEIRISIDAASGATYETIRGADAFAVILNNLRHATRVKAERGSATPRLSLWMTGLTDNIAELPRLVELAAELGIAEVYLQRLVTSERGLAARGRSLFRRRAEVAAAVSEAVELAARLGIALRGSGDLAADESLEQASRDKPWSACRRPWSLMYVTANGNVLPCCIAPFTDVPYASLVLGNVHEQSLDEIWNGPGFEAWRRAMGTAAPPTSCRGCGVDWSL